MNNSYSSLNTTMPSRTFRPTALELYPRRRHTEFYSEPQPMQEFQSRNSEHPHDKLCRSKYSLQFLEEGEVRCSRINPPRNSDMRMFRNSYFS